MDPASSFVGHDRPDFFCGAAGPTTLLADAVIGRPHPMQLGAVSEISLPQSGHSTSGNDSSKHDGAAREGHLSIMPRSADQVTRGDGAG
jgi:hypothetical protein